MKGLLFTFALTYGGSVAALFNPFVGLLIYVGFSILRPDSLWEHSLPAGGNYSRIVAIGLLVGWALNGFGQWSFGRARGIAIALALYWVWALVSALNAIVDVDAALLQFEAHSKMFLPFFVGLTTIRTLGQVKALAWVIVLCQGYLAYEFNVLYYTWPMFDPNEWTFATLDRNGIAITMVASSGLAFFLGLYSPRWWQRLFCFALAGLMAHVVLFSMSRGGMLAMAVTGLVTFVLIPKRPIYVFIFVLAMAAGLRLAGPAVWERFNTSFEKEGQRDGSAESRTQLWGACIKVMAAYPITGIGLRQWLLVSHLYGFTVSKDAHTMWLHVGAEMGVPGLLFLVAFYGLCCARLWPLTRIGDGGDPWLRTIACMVIASLVGFAVSAQFVSVYGVELPFYVVLLGAGALKLATQTAADAPAAAPMVGRPMPAWGSQ